MVQHEFCRDPAIRFRLTMLPAFPRTMLSKRVEDGETITVEVPFESPHNRPSALLSAMNPVRCLPLLKSVEFKLRPVSKTVERGCARSPPRCREVPPPTAPSYGGSPRSL